MVLTFPPIYSQPIKKVKLVKCFYTACSFSTTLKGLITVYLSPWNLFFKHILLSNDRGLSLNDKTKDHVDRNAGGQVNSLQEVTQLG